MTNDTDILLETIGIAKYFGDLVALQNVNMQLRRGSFHALLGENGAGKSTLVKCIMGYYRADKGTILLNGREHAIDNPRQAHDLGLGMVYQHFTLIPNMTVAENFVLARPHLPAVIDWRAELAALERRMQDMPFKVPLQASVNTLSAGEKQKVEIIKQLLLDSQLLILDEPTSVLTPNEADEVLGQIRAMVLEQQLTVLIITHKFREVMNYTDEVTVLRRGKYVGSCRVADTDPKVLSAMMMGSEVIATPLVRETTDRDETVIEITDLIATGDEGGNAVDGLSLEVCAGEIVGVAGVSGNGQREFVESLCGQREPVSGNIRLHQQDFTPDRQSIKQHRFRCIPEEPLLNACVGNMSVGENLALHHYDEAPITAGGVLLKRGQIAANAKRLIADYKIKADTPDVIVGTLSGGNVQRTVLARELSDEVDVLVVANPVFGLDFRAVEEIHNRIMQARNRGAAVILVSEDLDELLEMSDRLFVMSAGKLVYQTTPAEADRNVIGQYMAGH